MFKKFRKDKYRDRYRDIRWLNPVLILGIIFMLFLLFI